MATSFTHKTKHVFMNDPMVTYNHMDEEPGIGTRFVEQSKGTTRILWTVLLEETLIIAMTFVLVWTSIH